MVAECIMTTGCNSVSHVELSDVKRSLVDLHKLSLCNTL